MGNGYTWAKHLAAMDYMLDDWLGDVHDDEPVQNFELCAGSERPVLIDEQSLRCLRLILFALQPVDMSCDEARHLFNKGSRGWLVDKLHEHFEPYGGLLDWCRASAAQEWDIETVRERLPAKAKYDYTVLREVAEHHETRRKNANELFWEDYNKRAAREHEELAEKTRREYIGKCLLVYNLDGVLFLVHNRTILRPLLPPKPPQTNKGE